MSLDNHIQGDFDPNNPSNQPYTEPRINEIWECLDAENYDRAYELLSEARKKVDQLRKTYKLLGHDYAVKKLNEIYNIL